MRSRVLAPLLAAAPLALASATPFDAAAEPSAIEPSAVEPAAEPDAAPRLTSIAQVTWIYERPARGKLALGYVRVGTSVALREREPVRGDGCKRGWYAVEPRGYVCHDRTTLLDGEASERQRAYLRDLAIAGPSIDAPFPYRYALSMGAPMYGRIPDEAEQRREAARFGHTGPRTLGPWAGGHDELATDEPIAAHDEIPAWLLDGGASPGVAAGDDRRLVRRTIPLGSMLSFSKAFEAGGRTWLLSPDLTLVPADRVRPFRPSEFHGVALGGDVALPLAFIRKHPRPKLRRGDDGAFVPTGETWSVRAVVSLTGASVVVSGKRYLETKESGVYLAASDATLVEPHAPPPGAKGDDKWLRISIGQGTLVAYEGTRPVFATLVSPGHGGAPPASAVTNADLVAGSHTPLGVYRIAWKDRFAAMSPDAGEPRTFWIADVPYTQYFRAPFALHASYWHEDFGEPKSAGCVNLSPIDAKRLFEWTDPPVPDGWQGARPGGGNGKSTIVWIVP